MQEHEDIRFATDDVVIYLAAAGSGKTSKLMEEVTELLKTYRPDEIAFVTHTRKGVYNGIEQAAKNNAQFSADDFVNFKTLHALCFRELGLKRASMIGREHIKEFNRAYGFKLHAQDEDGRKNKDDEMLARYDRERTGGAGGTRGFSLKDEKMYQRFVTLYEEFKKKNKLVDFCECLLRYSETGGAVGVKAALIDEAQDLSLLQWEVCRIAFAGCEKIRIAGDDYQAIFTYSGASPSTLIKLTDVYRTERSENSYRLPKAASRLARSLVGCIHEKADKDFEPVKDFEGFVTKVSSPQVLIAHIRKYFDKSGPGSRRWYFLFRVNCFIQEVVEALERQTIPYSTAAGFCVPEPELAKIKRYEAYQKGFGSGDAFERFCAKYSIKDIKEDFTESDLVATGKQYIYLSYVQKYGIAELERMAHSEPSILLSTIHQVKGGEADYVVVFLDSTRRVDANARLNPDEEYRVLYVACTRVKRGLYIVSSHSGYGLDKMMDTAVAQGA